MALWGVAVGGILVGIGYFTAVDWKTGESDWTLGAGLAVTGGILFVVYCVYGAVRPRKATLLPPLILLLGATALGLVTVVADLLRGG